MSIEPVMVIHQPSADGEFTRCGLPKEPRAGWAEWPREDCRACVLLERSQREGWELSNDWLDLVHRTREGAVKMIDQSAFVMSLISNGEPDIKMAIETGLSIFMDKPIIAVVLPGAPVPENMRRLAYEIVEVDVDTEEGKAELVAAMKRQQDRLDQ